MTFLPKIARIVVNLPIEGPFDYHIGEAFQKSIALGQRVRIMFNRRVMVGFVVGFAKESEFEKLNPILGILDEQPALDSKALELTKKISEYYGCSLGEAIGVYLPPQLRVLTAVSLRAVAKQSLNKDCFVVENTPRLSADKAGNDTNLESKFKQENKSISPIFIVQAGVERWSLVNQYIFESITKYSVICLVPETVHIDELLEHLDSKLHSKLILLNKKLTPKQELEQWLLIKQAKEPMVVIGTRSAVFAPLSNLGRIIVLDEENEAYKQEQSPHYNASKIALLRSDIENLEVVFISDAPSTEVFHAAKVNGWKIISSERTETQLVKVQIVDMTNYNPGKTSILSFPLQNNLQKVLDAQGKAVLYFNRKGFNTMTRCNQCGFALKCPRCDVNLTYLFSKKKMVCRHCQFEMEKPKMCPKCNGNYVRSSGTGIEKLESELTRLFPLAKVARYEKESLQFPKNANVVIATQALLRRHDFQMFNIVALLDFDAQLHRLDFRSGQKAFSLLNQLKGLAKEKLIVQTRMRDSYSLEAVLKSDFDGFYEKELQLRKELNLPPFKCLVAVGLRGREETIVLQQAHELYNFLSQQNNSEVEVSELHSDVHHKLRDQYRYTITLKGSSPEAILKCIKSALKNFKKKKNIIITVTVDA